MATARGTPINTLGGCRLIYGRAFDEPRAAIKIMASKKAKARLVLAWRHANCHAALPLYGSVIIFMTFLPCCALCPVSGGCFVHVQVLPFAKQIKSKL